MSIEVTVLFFAKAREIVGKQSTSLHIPTTVTYDNLRNIIAKEYSLEAIKNNIILAVNEEYCSEDQIITLKGGEEIAVIPPLSGG